MVSGTPEAAVSAAAERGPAAAPLRETATAGVPNGVPLRDSPGEATTWRTANAKQAEAIKRRALQAFRAELDREAEATIASAEAGQADRRNNGGRPCGPLVKLWASHYKAGQAFGPGNFEYDVRESPDGYMFIFNDNEEDSGTARPGRGNAAIRTFNAVENEHPRAMGVCTGSTKKGGYQTIEQARRRVRKDLEAILKQLVRAVKTERPYYRVVYSAANETNWILGKGVFDTSPEVRAYITSQLQNLVLAFNEARGYQPLLSETALGQEAEPRGKKRVHFMDEV